MFFRVCNCVVPIVTDADEFGVSKAASSFSWLVVLLVMEKISAYCSEAKGCLVSDYPLCKCIAVRARPVSVLIVEWIGFWRLFNPLLYRCSLFIYLF